MSRLIRLLHDEINRQREGTLASGFSWGGAEWDVSPWIPHYASFGLGGQLRDRANVVHTLTPAQVRDLCAAMLQFVQDAYSESWTMKAEIAAETDPDRAREIAGIGG